MARTLSEEEEHLLDEMIELAQVKNLNGLYKFVASHCGESDLDFIDEKLRLNMPAPTGKFRETFIIVVNDFVKYGQNAGTYPKTPATLSRAHIHATVASHFQTTDRTAGRKVNQLIALGWVERWHGNIRNPILTWYEALESGKPHPGNPINTPPNSSRSRDAQETDRRGGPSESSSSENP